jgi:hypothetical protein
VGDYQSPGLSTPTTAADAAGLGALLRDPKVATYPQNQVQVVLDAQATRDGILAELAQAEIELAGYARAADAPPVLVQRRDAPLARLEGIAEAAN